MARALFLRFLGYCRIYVLLLRYVYLHLKLYYLKAKAVTLIESARIRYCIRIVSRENPVMFAACIAICVYLVALSLLNRM